jgi:hypothetical protein
VQAFHNDEQIKQKYLARVKHHREMDNLIRGTGWANGKGCAVGCTLEAYEHNRYETELGIPEWLARVEDTLFEGMPKEDAMFWPERFLEAIPVGANLENVKVPFLIFILESTLDKFDHVKFPKIKTAIINVIKLYRDGETDLSKFDRAADAAKAAAEAAAGAAGAGIAAGAAAWAAWAAAWTAATWTAEATARAAEAAGAAAWALRNAAEKETEYKKFADKLIELLKDCR